MTYGLRWAVAASALAFAVFGAHAAEFGDLGGSVGVMVSSAYRTSSSGLLDTYPVTTQMMNWRLSLAEFGFLEGYAWSISSLHNKQREQHRVMFYDNETAVQYGYAVQLAEDVKLSTSVGPYFDFPVGYRNAHMKCWGPYAVQRLANPFVTAYWRGLWIVESSRRGRVCAGLEKRFAPMEKLTVVPFVECTWMDRRRFNRRYGEEPRHGVMRGGAFAHMQVGVKVSWSLGENLRIVGSAAMYDIVNSQARRSIRRSDAYYAKNDWPIFGIGVEYLF